MSLEWGYERGSNRFLSEIHSLKTGESYLTPAMSAGRRCIPFVH